MVYDRRIRELRRRFATHSLNDVGWDQGTGRLVTLAAALATRRRMREFRRVLFRSEAFHKLLQYSDESEDGPIAFALMLLKMIASSTLSRKRGKEIRDISLQAERDAGLAGRVLRQTAFNTADQERKDMILLLAQQIENTPHLAIDDGPLRLAASLYDFRLIGQKGDRRAFLINHMNFVLPSSVPHRYAMIGELLAVIGIRANRHLVRSTIKKSLT